MRWDLISFSIRTSRLISRTPMAKTMNNNQLSGSLEAMILERIPLQQVVTTLRNYRGQGVTRDEVRLALEGMRDRTTDDEVDDRILEVMDVVSGFCSRDNSVW
jgi:hypothetical protein